MSSRSKFIKYFRQYKWSNVWEMVVNGRSDPLICTDDFRNKLVVITGATSGIGYQTAMKFASNGANLLCINRNPDKSTFLKNEVESNFNVYCDFLIADLSDIDDIYLVANKLANNPEPIDVVIHNAGIYLTEKELTREGYDKVFVVHHLSSFIINNILKNKLKSQAKAKILMVGSEAYRFAAWGLKLDDMNWTRRKYTGLRSYGAAKLAQILSMHVLVEEFKNSNVTINTVHPGAVKSSSGQENGFLYRWFKRNYIDKTLREPELSAEALYSLAVSKEFDKVTGKFYNFTTLESLAPPAMDIDEARKLWDISMQMSGLDKYNF